MKDISFYGYLFDWMMTLFGFNTWNLQKLLSDNLYIWYFIASVEIWNAKRFCNLNDERNFLTFLVIYIYIYINFLNGKTAYTWWYIHIIN